MFYLEKVREILKGLYVFLSSQVFRFFIELGEVLVISCRKIMEDGGNCSGLYWLGKMGETRLGMMAKLSSKVS